MFGSDKTNSASSTGDPATLQVDVQDPLPETNWFWRRFYTFTLSLIVVGLIWYGVEAMHRLNDAFGLYRITRYLIFVLVILITYYMVAPSAEQIVKLVQAAKLLRSGVPITRRATSDSPQGGHTEVETTVGHSDPPATPEYTPEAPQEDYAPRSRS